MLSDDCTTLNGLQGAISSLATWGLRVSSCTSGYFAIQNILPDWNKRSPPAATSQGVRPDKIIMEVYEHIGRLGSRIVAIDDRIAKWEKKMTKLEKRHEDESEKRNAAELKIAAFEQTVEKAVTSILASVVPTSAQPEPKTKIPVRSTLSSPLIFRHPVNRVKPYATYSDPDKQDNDSDSMSEAETMVAEVNACGVEIPADSDSEWILVTRKTKRAPK